MIDILKICSEWTSYHDLNRLAETAHYNTIIKKPQWTSQNILRAVDFHFLDMSLIKILLTIYTHNDTYVETELKYFSWYSSTGMAIQGMCRCNHRRILEQEILTVKPGYE